MMKHNKIIIMQIDVMITRANTPPATGNINCSPVGWMETVYRKSKTSLGLAIAIYNNLYVFIIAGTNVIVKFNEKSVLLIEG